jgi:AraC-like DNA-binding protein
VNPSATVRASAGAYGRTLVQRFGAEDAPFIVTRSLRRGEMAVTELRVDQPMGRLCDPFAPEDAYLIGLLAMLRGRGSSLSMIALACGFADQSHFTRVFTRRVGLSPGT